MRVAASIVGIVGGLCGIFFVQLVVSVGVMLAVVTSATQNREMELAGDFYLGLLALVLYAIGVAAAVIVRGHPLLGAALLLVSAVGSLVATIAINGAPSEGGGAFVANAFPYAGSVLMFAAAALAAFDLRAALRVAASPAPAAPLVIPARAELASAVPMSLLAEPAANASTVRQIEPGTSFESIEQHGEFVHVRGVGFEGFLPAWSVRRV